MQGTPPVVRMTYAEYVAQQETALEKLDYIAGEVFAMSGGSLRHAALAAAVTSELRRLARPRGCTVFSADLRVRVPETDFSAYPDASVVCGEAATAAEDRHACTNPTLVVEVLSPSSEAYDRGAKSAHYRRISSLREIVLVTQDPPLIEVYRKNEHGRWELMREARAGERVEIASLGGEIEVDDVYEGAPPVERP